MATEKTLKERTISLSQAWEKQAQRWAMWARKPAHDSYWQFHRDQFFALLPEPGMLVPSLTEGSIKRSRKFAVVRPTFRTATAHKVLRVKTAPAPNDQLQLGFRRVIARYRLAEPDLTYPGLVCASVPARSTVPDRNGNFRLAIDSNERRGALRRDTRAQRQPGEGRDG